MSYMHYLNYRNWNKWVFGTVLFLTLCVGAAIGADTPETVQAEPEVRVETREVVKQVENTDRFNRLKEVDEAIFVQSGEVIDAQTKALNVAATLLGNLETLTLTDVETGTQMINEQTERIKAATAEVERLQSERAAVLAN